GDMTMISAGVITGDSIMTSAGVITGDGIPFLPSSALFGDPGALNDGDLLGDGVITGDGGITGDGVITGDMILQAQRATVGGDPTTSLPLLLDDGTDCY